jgi:hypothetical protein
MPKVRRCNVPRALVAHLEDRVRDRDIPIGQLQLLSEWLNGEPEVPAGKWFKRFPGMIACGEGEFLKTFLRTGQVPEGEEIP